MKDPPLQPLRVPQNWTIKYNTFHEIDPSEALRRYFCEDLFLAECARTNVIVGMGWYPDGDPLGSFVIVAHVGDFRGELLVQVEAATRLEAVEKLEAMLWKYHFTLPPGSSGLKARGARSR